MVDDFDYKTQQEYVFGFDSEAAFLDWFSTPSWRDRLYAHGFVLNVYDVPAEDVILGSKQLVFMKAKARLVSTKLMTEFCEQHVAVEV